MKNPKSSSLRPTVRRMVGFAGVAVAAMLAVFGSNALAASFTQGNLVVERVGDGSTTLSSAGFPIFFDEITTAGTAVQSISIPSSGSSALVDSSAASDGGMNLSTDGKSLVFPGYNTNSGVTSIVSSNSAMVPRGIGKLDANGNYTLVATSTAAYSGNNIRGAASDGNNNYWGSGTASSGSYGIYYFGTASSASAVYSANLRSIGIYNNNLWYSTASSTPGYGLWQFTGTPTTAVGNTATHVITLASTNSPYNFSVSPNGTVVYFTDDSTTAKGGGIYKWVQNSGTWSQAYILYSNAVFGLTVDWTTTPATLYATTGSGAVNNTLIKLQDTGASATATCSPPPVQTSSIATWPSLRAAARG